MIRDQPGDGDVPPRARFFLTRHGETVWHAENRYAGADSDVDLTALGRTQAATLASWAAGQELTRLVVSPVRRARETAEPVASATGLSVQVEGELREAGFGEAEGRTVAELTESDPEMVRRFREDPAAHPFPGAEPPEQAARRAASCLWRLADEDPGALTLVVAHNTVLRLALCQVLRLPISHYRRLFPRLENAAITELELDPVTRTGSLVRLNASPTPPSDHA